MMQSPARAPRRHTIAATLAVLVLALGGPAKVAQGTNRLVLQLLQRILAGHRRRRASF